MLMSPRRTHGDAGEHLGPQMQEGKDPEYQRRGKKRSGLGRYGRESTRPARKSRKNDIFDERRVSSKHINACYCPPGSLY